MGRLITRNKGQQMRSRLKIKPSKTRRELGGRHVQDSANCKALNILLEKIKNVKQFSSEACSIFKVPEELLTNEKAKDAMIVDMEQLQDLPIRTLSEKLKNVKQLSAEACLFKVHERLRKPNPEAYTPLTISIGPYHHMKLELRKMERLKELYTQSFLDRRTGAGVEECWKKLKDLQGRAERYYGDLDDIKFVDDDEFVKMLLLDGCFIVEFVIRSCLRVLESKIGVREQNEDDPIYKMTSGMKSNIVRDMLLLENQLPFFVLKTLYDMTTKMIIVFDEKPKLSDMVKTTFLEMLPKINIFSLLDSTEVNTHENGIKHLLQVVHILCQPQPQNNEQKIQQQKACFSSSSSSSSSCFSWKQPQGGSSRGSDIESHSLSNRQDRWQLFPCFPYKFWEQPQQSRYDLCIIRTASELQEAGVDFKKVNETTTSLFDIKFNHGVLEIPSFTLFDLTEIFFRNLIAYEQDSWDVGSMYFTDYAVFMDDLINTEKDVNILRLKDVFLNGLGDDKEVTHLFNNLCQGVRTSSNDDFYYKDMYKELNRHYNKSWNVAMAKLRRNYFHSPWAVISTIAAILLLSLAILQTLIAAFDLYK